MKPTSAPIGVLEYEIVELLWLATVPGRADTATTRRVSRAEAAGSPSVDPAPRRRE